MKQKYCQSQNSLPIKFFCEINCWKIVVFLLSFDSRKPSNFAPLVVQKFSKIGKVEQGEIWQGLGEALESVLVCDERQEMLPIEGNSLVYGIYVVEISAYMLKYQHCWKISIVVMKFQHIGPSQSPTNLPESFHLIYLFWSTKKKVWSWYYDVRSDKDFSSNYITKWKYIKVSQDLES